MINENTVSSFTSVWIFDSMVNENTVLHDIGSKAKKLWFFEPGPSI